MSSPSPQPKPFAWTAAKERAAWLLAEDELSDEAIADQVKVNRRTLARWKDDPEFAARIRANIDQLVSAAQRRGLARLDRRMDAYLKRHERLMRIVEERGAEMDGEVAGGGSGFLLRIPKSVTHTYEPNPDDEDGKPITVRQDEFEYRTDTSLMRELRELEKQIAQDAGQWSEKQEISGPSGQPLTIVFSAREDGPS